MSQVLRIFDPNTMPLSELIKIQNEWSNIADREIRKIEITYEDFIPKEKPLLRGDIYRPTNHYIKNKDSSKFPAHEIGAEGVLLTAYYGSVDKALALNVGVWRREKKEFRLINKEVFKSE